MDFSSPAISLLIIWFGVHAYRRREKAHRAEMERLRHGEIPSAAGPKPRPWRLLTTGSICALMSGFAGMLFFTGGHAHDGADWPLNVMGGMITLPLLILILIFVRDVRHFTRQQESEKASKR
jgi:sterol desaturase/sphingolipid hydroxylase (fatty acid hydroxylase superfamily)